MYPNIFLNHFVFVFFFRKFVFKSIFSFFCGKSLNRLRYLTNLTKKDQTEKIILFCDDCG